MDNSEAKDPKKILGTILIWIGVLAWTPFLLLIFNDKEVSIWPFLIVHLAGSIGGAKLRGPEPEEEMAVGVKRRKISKILIYLGVMAWIPYIYLNSISAQKLPITPFLAAHLTGIFGGIFVRASVYFSLNKQRKSAEALLSQD